MSIVADRQDLQGLAEMLDALPERVVRYRVLDLTIVYCNASWAAWNNLEPSDVVGHSLDEFLSEDGRAGLTAQLARLGPDSPLVADKVVRADPNDPGKWVEWVDRYLPGADGAEILAVGRDVTARHIAETKLAESEARFRELADKASDVMWRFAADPYPHFDYISPSIEKILGYPPSYFIEDFARFVDILSDDDKALIDRAFDGEQLPELCDFHYRRADGTFAIGEMQIREIRGGLQGVGRDVTEIRRLQADLAALALRDPLTGLANRRLFKELLDADLARTQRGGQPLAVAYLDLDDFKCVNDCYGHEAGDSVLCETARRLLSTVRGADVVARLGGDEFVIVYEPNEPSSDDLPRRVERVLSMPIVINDDIMVCCPASIGVSDTRVVGHDAATLLAVADAAMYEVKRAHHRLGRPGANRPLGASAHQRPSGARETYAIRRM